MVGLKELRTRIDAIKSTQKITSAMKMVAASRLRRVQILVDKGQEYSENLRRSALRVISEIEMEEKEKNIRYIRPQLLQKIANPKNYLLLVFSSDRGLCGAYNNNIAKKAIQRIEQLLAGGKKVKVLCSGKKAYDVLKRTYTAEQVELQLVDTLKDDITYAEATEQLAHYILQQFTAKAFDVCECVYSDFLSAVSRTFCCEQVCPLELNSEHLSEDELAQINRVGNAYYEYLPDKMTILTQILPIIFNDNIFRILTNTSASEHGARMSSMDNATRNANKMIEELTLRYNSLRQSAITTELIEIIAGADAI